MTWKSNYFRLSNDQAHLQRIFDIFPDEDDIDIPRLPKNTRFIPYHLPSMTGRITNRVKFVTPYLEQVASHGFMCVGWKEKKSLYVGLLLQTGNRKSKVIVSGSSSDELLRLFCSVEVSFNNSSSDRIKYFRSHKNSSSHEILMMRNCDCGSEVSLSG